MVRTLDALRKCRTSALGGHKEACDCCGKERISYNSCGNRHCPKCQATKQALWVEDRMNNALDVKYFHVVFTVPEALNTLCLLDSKQFYKNMFECVWSVLETFGYSHYGVESGAQTKQPVVSTSIIARFRVEKTLGCLLRTALGKCTADCKISRTIHSPGSHQ